MNLVMDIKSAGSFEFTHLFNTKEIIEDQSANSKMIVEQHIPVGGYYPIVFFNDRYCLLTKSCNTSVVFASSNDMDNLLKRMELYCEYEVMSPVQYNKVTGEVVIGGKYEVDLL